MKHVVQISNFYTDTLLSSGLLADLAVKGSEIILKNIAIILSIQWVLVFCNITR